MFPISTFLRINSIISGPRKIKNCFNIYYQGNSLAKVILSKDGTYSAEIHKEFLPDVKKEFGRPVKLIYEGGGISSDVNHNRYFLNYFKKI